MKILTFLGANGFIGRSFLDAFSRGLLKKFKINKLILISRNIKELKKISIGVKGISFIKTDIKKLKKIPKSDYIIYGSEIAILKSVNKQELKNSAETINNFCRIVQKQKNPPKVLYLSSGAVYRHNNKNLTRIQKTYSSIKLYSENCIKQLEKFNIKTSIARCFTFVGAWLPRKSKYAIGNFLNDVLNDKKKKKL